MKKILFLCLLTCSAGFLSAEQSSSKMAIAIGAEWNNNSPQKIASAAGGVFSFDYNLGTAFAIGVNFTASNDFNGVTSLEPAALFRWYFLSRRHEGLYAQAEAGTLIALKDGEDTHNRVSGRA